MTQVLETETHAKAKSKRGRQIFSGRLLGAMLADIVLTLGYFWVAQISYGSRISSSSMTLLIAIEYGSVHWHGPDVYILSSIGLLAPLLCVLPLIPMWLLLRRFPLWGSLIFWLLWIGEVMALGFFIPRTPFL